MSTTSIPVTPPAAGRRRTHPWPRRFPYLPGGSGRTTAGPGFSECLALFMPNASGAASIDYWTQTSHTLGTVNLSAGKVATVNVNQAVGPNQQVSVRVTLPGPGVVERLLRFNVGAWHGST